MRYGEMHGRDAALVYKLIRLYSQECLPNCRRWSRVPQWLACSRQAQLPRWGWRQAARPRASLFFTGAGTRGPRLWASALASSASRTCIVERRDGSRPRFLLRHQGPRKGSLCCTIPLTKTSSSKPPAVCRQACCSQRLLFTVTASTPTPPRCGARTPCDTHWKGSASC